MEERAAKDERVVLLFENALGKREQLIMHNIGLS